MDLQTALEPIMKIIGVEPHQEDMMHHIRRRLAVTFDSKKAHDKCKLESETDATGKKVTDPVTI